MNVKVDDTRLTFPFVIYNILSGVSRVPPDVGFNNISIEHPVYQWPWYTLLCSESKEVQIATLINYLHEGSLNDTCIHNVKTIRNPNAVVTSLLMTYPKCSTSTVQRLRFPTHIAGRNLSPAVMHSRANVHKNRFDERRDRKEISV